MKHVSFICVGWSLMMFSAFPAFAGSYDFSEQVERLWGQGLEGIGKVRDISKSRLLNDENDIIGLTLKLEDAALYSRFKEVEELADKIISSGKNMNSSRLTVRIELLKKQVDSYLKAKDMFPPDMLTAAQERLKLGQGMEGLPMVFSGVVRICEDEGLVKQKIN